MTGSDIADRLEEANRQAVEFVLGPARSHWDEEGTAEGWPVGVTARHIALGHELMAEWATALKSGREITGTGDIDDVNAEQARLGVVATPDEVARALEENVQPVSAALRLLTEAELAGSVTFAGRQMPAAMLAEASVRHVEVHLASLRQACEQT